MGVEHIWVVDPRSRIGYAASTQGFKQAQNGIFAIPGTLIRIYLAEVFAEFDEDQAGA